jgi:glycerol-3-phosphate dehydrogenase (NAD(P)+)
MAEPMQDPTTSERDTEPRRIAVIGAGAWGTALASVFARNGHRVVLWGRDAETCAEINRSHTNTRYLGAVALPPALGATTDLAAALAGAGIVFLVVPTQQIREVATRMSGLLAPGAVVINCAKGIHRETGLLPNRVLAQALPGTACGVLSGPSFAEEVSAGKPTAVTLAMPTARQAIELAGLLSGPDFRIYASDDVTGVEAGGALKNIVAIAVGICRGMDLGSSAEAALIARGNAELLRFAVAMGAQPNTLQGLSGLGDLVLTCSSLKSRNFSYGVALGRRDSRSPARLAEGVHTAGIASELAARQGIDAPIIDMVSRIVAGSISLEAARAGLLNRPVKIED